MKYFAIICIFSLHRRAGNAISSSQTILILFSQESIYYRHYLTLIVQTQPLDQFMALYDLLVPNVYIPEPDVMDEILQAIELAGAVDADNLLPRIWSNMVMFDHVQRPNLTTRVLRMMHTNCSPAPESPVNKQYADIAWQIWTYIEVF